MSSFPFYQIGCIIRRVQFKHVRFQVVKLSVWFTSGLQYCSFYIIYSGWKADSVAFVVPPCVYIRVYSTVVIKIYAKVLFAITFFSVAGAMHPKKVWVLFIQIYKFTIKCETRKKKRGIMNLRSFIENTKNPSRGLHRLVFFTCWNATHRCALNTLTVFNKCTP